MGQIAPGGSAREAETVLRPCEAERDRVRDSDASLLRRASSRAERPNVNMTTEAAQTLSALERVYDAATLANYVEYLAVKPPPPEASHVRWRLDVLTAHGSAPSDPDAARQLKRRRARRAAFETYVEAANLCGLLDANMVGRLRSVEERNFRSALSECVACWVFAGMLGYGVSPREGGGRPGKQLEFAVTAPADSFVVEVKAPTVERPAGNSWSGDDAHVLEAALKDAASQFGKGTKNVLVIAPSLRTSVWSDRDQLVKALIGEPVVIVHVPLDSASRGYSKPGFAPRGRLVRPGKMGPDGTRLPAHTRVSTVMVVEVVEAERAELEPLPAESVERQLAEWVRRRFSEENAFWPAHRVLVVHNPNADMPISSETFARFPQLVKISETDMAWTDRNEEDSDDDD